MNVALWIVQGLLAALFLFAGVMKLVLPLEALKGPIDFPGWFMRFIGVAETLGGLGLILPGIFRIATWLTPLAAAGLIVIMMGAVYVTIFGGELMGGIISLVVGLLAALVLYGRWRVMPLRGRESRVTGPGYAR
jgi:hypothetical protein